MSYTSTGFQNPFGFRVTEWVKRLLIINGVVFLVVLAFRGLIPYLQFHPGNLLTQPWGPLTYMFVHERPFHLLFNMLALFFFGPPLEERWGGTEFLKFFILCGVGGAILSLVFPYPIIGASAAVYGVMVAFAMYWPDNPIYFWGIFPIKAKWLVGGLVGLSVFFALTGGAPGIAHLAHLGGALAAFGYLKSGWGPTQFGPRLRKPKKRGFKVESRAPEKRPVRNVPAGRQAVRRTTEEEARLLDEVDRILDKISKQGLESLSSEERARLDEASRKYRTS